MRKYKIIGAAVIFFAILSIIVLSLNPTWNVEAGEKPENLIADILLWIELALLAISAIAFIVYKLYKFIKHTLLKKRADEDIDDYVIKSRSYRSKYDE